MRVFIFDFDGTITTQDTTDLILELPSEDQIWRIEEEWKKGKLSSYQCMQAQARFLRGITLEEVHETLQQSHVDPCFSNLIHFLKTQSFNIMLLSEGYDISLRFHNVQKYIKNVYCSTLLTKNERLTGEITVLNERTWSYNKKCFGCCICKVDFLLKLRKQFNITQSFAVGDGASDECLFQYVDVSFSLNPSYKATYQVKDLSAVLKILKKKHSMLRLNEET